MTKKQTKTEAKEERKPLGDPQLKINPRYLEAFALYEGGGDIRDLCKKYKKKKSVVYDWIKQAREFLLKTKTMPKKKRGKSRKAKITKDLIGKFLELLANNGGIVCDAARDLHISRTSLYRVREEDPEFKKAWDKAVSLGVDVIEDEAKRRALDGVKEPVYYQGNICGYIWKKSDYCIGLVLKAHRAAYKDKHEISGPGGKPLTGNVTIYLPDNKRQKKEKES